MTDRAYRAPAHPGTVNGMHRKTVPCRAPAHSPAQCETTVPRAALYKARHGRHSPAPPTTRGAR